MSIGYLGGWITLTYEQVGCGVDLEIAKGGILAHKDSLEPVKLVAILTDQLTILHQNVSSLVLGLGISQCEPTAVIRRGYYIGHSLPKMQTIPRRVNSKINIFRIRPL
jgi:hypothetical protein